MLRNESGASRFAVFFWVFLLGLCTYVAIKIVPVYMDFYRMQDTMEVSAKANAAQFLKDEEMMANLVAKAKELDLPLTADSFIVRKDANARKMTISTAWEVETHFLGDTYIYTFKFAPTVETPIARQ
ncbi:MAG: hypothetical protein M0042_01985 [Nitrospiraceae bacterium]|nr:hypothetical protein [Nitrospiraceae bacterium]